VTVAEVTLEKIQKSGIVAAIVTATTPINERMALLKQHEDGEIEAMVSVGVLAEGWDNPHCNMIVHLRPTLSKVVWGQTVGRGLRSAPGKDKCIVIDVSSNWSTFGPVEKLQWSLWNHRRSYVQFKNRFNWIGQQLEDDNSDNIYLLCENKLASGLRCSHIYKKHTYSDGGCPVCGSVASIDIRKEQKIDSTLNEIGLRRLFYERVEKVYQEMDLSIWGTLGNAAWKSAEPKEMVFLAFCMAFSEVSSEATNSESEFWDVALSTEAKIRGYLVGKKIQIVKQDDFQLTLIANGMLAGKQIRTLQSHYGISLCGNILAEHSDIEIERKYLKALRISERLAVMGCSSRDNLPYFNASEYLAKKAS
jgi:hypothetical protein